MISGLSSTACRKHSTQHRGHGLNTAQRGLSAPAVRRHAEVGPTWNRFIETVERSSDAIKK